MASPSPEAGAGAAADLLPAIAAGGQAIFDLILPIAVAVLAVAVVVLVLRDRRRGRQIRTVEEACAKLFGKGPLSLPQIPAELDELDTRIADLLRRLERRERSTASPLRHDVMTEFLSLIGALRRDALAEIDKLADDAQFARLDKVLGIRAALIQLEARFGQIEQDRDLTLALLRELETSNGLDAALTTPDVVEAYFDGVEAWKPLSRRLRAIEQMLRAAFLRLDVDIVVNRPFSVVERGRPTHPADAPRDLSALDVVRDLAERRARSIPDRSAIVLDCFAPGFTSSRIGRRPPSFTVYDPAA